MITAKIKKLIQDDTAEMAATNPLITKARQGTLTKPEVVTYLYNLMYFFHHTPIHLDLAYRRATELGLNEVADFMKEKIGEETGHEMWASNDLKKQAVPFQEVDQSKVTPATRRFLAYAKEIIQEDPTLFLSYMAFCEYFTVLAAPELLDNLEQKCGVPREGMTAIYYHEQLDKDHVDDDMAIIESVVRDPSHEAKMLEAVKRSGRMVNDFLAECTSP